MATMSVFRSVLWIAIFVYVMSRLTGAGSRDVLTNEELQTCYGPTTCDSAHESSPIRGFAYRLLTELVLTREVCSRSVPAGLRHVMVCARAHLFKALHTGWLGLSRDVLRTEDLQACYRPAPYDSAHESSPIPCFALRLTATAKPLNAGCPLREAAAVQDYSSHHFGCSSRCTTELTPLQFSAR